MIYLSFNHSSLLCTVWSSIEEESILTSLIQVPLTGVLNQGRTHEKEMSSVLEQTFKSLLNETQLDGHDVYITIPDSWVISNFTQIDVSMTNDDIWEYILWQKNCRLGSLSSDYLTFAQQTNGVNMYCVHAPSILTTGLKLSLIEYGAAPKWFGTESMTFTGKAVQPFVFIMDEGKTYKSYLLSRDNIRVGSLRLIKGEWKVSKSFMFGEDIIQTLKGDSHEPGRNLLTIYSLDQLSEKKLAHWNKYNFQYIKPFLYGNTESVESFADVPYRQLAVQSVLLDERFHTSELNFFNGEGLFEKKKKIVIAESPKPEKPKKTKHIKTNRKKQSSKKGLKIIATVASLGLFGLIIYDYFGKKMESIERKSSHQIIISPNLNNNQYKKNVVKYELPESVLTLKRESVSMVRALNRTIENIGIENISFLSINSGNLQIEIFGEESIKKDISHFGRIINYSIQGISCCGGYKHLYDFSLPMNQESIPETISNKEDFISILKENSVNFSKLKPIRKGRINQFPIIIKSGKINRIFDIIEILNEMKQNIILRKATITIRPENREINSVFYVSIFERKRY